jgi:hypothetical protein
VVVYHIGGVQTYSGGSPQILGRHGHPAGAPGPNGVISTRSSFNVDGDGVYRSSTTDLMQDVMVEGGIKLKK